MSGHKPEPKAIRKRRAQIEAEQAGKWLCKTCDTLVETDGDYCRACAQYWQDVASGMFDDDFASEGW